MDLVPANHFANTVVAFNNFRKGVAKFFEKLWVKMMHFFTGSKFGEIFWLNSYNAIPLFAPLLVDIDAIAGDLQQQQQKHLGASYNLARKLMMYAQDSTPYSDLVDLVRKAAFTKEIEMRVQNSCVYELGLKDPSTMPCFVYIWSQVEEAAFVVRAEFDATTKMANFDFRGLPASSYNAFLFTLFTDLVDVFRLIEQHGGNVLLIEKARFASTIIWTLEGNGTFSPPHHRPEYTRNLVGAGSKITVRMSSSPGTWDMLKQYVENAYNYTKSIITRHREIHWVQITYDEQTVDILIALWRRIKSRLEMSGMVETRLTEIISEEAYPTERYFGGLVHCLNTGFQSARLAKETEMEKYCVVWECGETKVMVLKFPAGTSMWKIAEDSTEQLQGARKYFAFLMFPPYKIALGQSVVGKPIISPGNQQIVLWYLDAEGETLPTGAFLAN